MPADRMQQVNELLHRAIAEMIQREVELPQGSFVTITSVKTSRDLANAFVYVVILPDGKRASTMKRLQKSAGHIQSRLGSRIKIRITPRLHFRFDEGEMKAQHIYDILDKE